MQGPTGQNSRAGGSRDLGESAGTDPALAADLSWGTAAGFGLSPVCWVSHGAGPEQMSLADQGQSLCLESWRSRSASEKWLLHISTGCIVGSIEGDRKRICALQTQIAGQELHVAAPNVILRRKG